MPFLPNLQKRFQASSFFLKKTNKQTIPKAAFSINYQKEGAGEEGGGGGGMVEAEEKEGKGGEGTIAALLST